MRTFSFFALIAGLGLAQVTVMETVRVFSVKPDLLFASIMLVTLYCGWRQALCLSVWAGFLKDMFAVLPVGMHMLLFCAWAVVFLRLARKISLDNPVFAGVVIFVAVLLNDCLMRMLFLFAGNLIGWYVFVKTAFLEALYTALILPVLMKLCEPLLAMTPVRRPEEQDEEVQP